MKLIKFAACYISAFSMAIAPFAEAKGKELQQKEKINEYLRFAGLATNKTMTIKQYWSNVRSTYPQDLQKQMDEWVKSYGDQKMPNIQAVHFTDAEGKDQVRLLLSTPDHQSETLTLTGNEEAPLKINNYTFSKSDLNNLNLEQLGEKLIDKDPYFKKIYDTQKSKKDSALNQQNQYRVFAQFLLGASAYAGPQSDNGDLTGQPCLIAGFMSTYGESGSCAGVYSGGAELHDQITNEAFGVRCGQTDTPCNPLVYGFKQQGGRWAPHCVPGGDLKDGFNRGEMRGATNYCDGDAKLRPGNAKDKEDIINSYMSVVNKKKFKLKLDADGRATDKKQYDQVKPYLDNLNSFIDKAEAHCNSRDYGRTDQQDACDSIKTRRITLEYAGKDGGAVAGGDSSGCVKVCKKNNWLLPVGIILGLGLVACLIFCGGKGHKPPIIRPPVIPPVDPHPTPTPTPKPSEGGTLPDPGNAGGVYQQKRGGNQ